MMNQHIRQPFWFSDEQIDALIASLDTRIDLLTDIFPWRDVNFGMDQQWAALMPYYLTIKQGEEFGILEFRG